MTSMKLYWQAGKDLAQRYLQIWRAVWALRHELDTPQRPEHELAFLPAHLAVRDTPVHPAPRWAMRALMALALLVLLWSCFGQLDEVAVAHGKLVPNAQVKMIQSAETGTVRAILVNNGQRVKAGQPLLELDTTMAGADASKTRLARLDAMVSIARAHALLEALKTSRPPRLAPVPGLSDIRQTQAQQFAEGQYREFLDKQGAQRAELIKRQAELESTRREIDKLRQTAPLARQSADAYRSLVKDNYVSRQDYLQKEQQRIEQEQNLAGQQSHARELEAGIEEQRRILDAATSSFRRELWDALNQAQQQLPQFQGEETKARQREARMQLRAPVNGTVQQLVVHTVGGVVTQAQTVLEIVPDDTLEVEANIENKDIGFVRAGQQAIVKVESFPFSRYGYLDGKVLKVSNDAVSDRKLGLIFPSRLHLSQNRIRVEDTWVKLSPGMAVTVEVKTGRRSVAAYFLSPLIEYGQESLRER
ncbi:HlyD family type I secretion periplasmic adaptor subunit [Chromobacterium sp. IIBBL 290-4]|uniref:HlyD family type I secretion periplasmic adaptor subunit n=1 Tax=Chromobacterium sp. IIBBL 290-4 TaxID=2953890 RepID=UPI0020B78918|nr:HlyD family type I secretion periplasmic adaptor subunit [Chromobacterium sp. IIBBL 290-4]UTH76395.1 HlyD family type I secretion periplasmic adaptor subunit [Chromobacterium sp. IIBBL 290-4]